jgi:L-2-hydroxycarboxylate dehydrogenase (NAD+)
MNGLRIAAEPLRQFVTQVFERIGIPRTDAADAANVLMWASLRGVDTHGVRNLKSYYVDNTLAGLLRPAARLRIEHENPSTARLDGDSGLGLSTACQAMRLAIAKARQTGICVVCVRNSHHLGPAGYFAHMAVEPGMLGACATGHFFGKGHPIGISPLGSAVAMLSTNPLSFAAPCGRHAPFVLDMSTSVATVNRIEMHAQEGRSIPAGWARDAADNPTTDATAARLLFPLGGIEELGGYKGTGLAMMVSILSGVLSGAWAPIDQEFAERTSDLPTSGQYDQPTMGHIFAAAQIEALQPLNRFQSAMDAMIDALHAAPRTKQSGELCYPGEIESRTAAERRAKGIPLTKQLHAELQTLAEDLMLELPQTTDVVN